MENGLDRHIETTPGVRGGKPRLSGRRITVDDIVLMHLRLNQSLPEIAGKFDLELAALYAVMAYYYEHQAEIDQRIMEDEVFIAAFQQNNPSPLQDKLRTLNLN